MLNKSKEALNKEDIQFFVDNLPKKEHWRILAKFFDKAVYFDIETTGISWMDNHTTVIAAYKDDKVYSYVYKDNLDDFLDLLSQSDLIVSFNGNSFDVPFLEKTFNIPSLNCPHIDLRWVCYHAGYKNGLKEIERNMDIERPSDLIDVTGYDAIILYYRWQAGDNEAKEKLIKYCQADAISTYIVSMKILSKYNININQPDQNFFKILDT